MTSLYRLARVDAGYHAERVLAAEIFGNFTRYKNAEGLPSPLQAAPREAVADAGRSIGRRRHRGPARSAGPTVPERVRDPGTVVDRTRPAGGRRQRRQHPLLRDARDPDHRRTRLPRDRHNGVGAGGGDQPVDGPLLGRRGSRRLARLLRQRRALVHRRRRHRHRAAVRARARWRRAAVHRAQPVAVPGGRQPPAPHDRRSRLDDGGRARRRPLAGSGHAGGARRRRSRPCEPTTWRRRA